MHVICDRDLLAPALCSISRMAKNEVYPLYAAVLLTASAGQMPEQGTLTLVGLGSTVGLFTQLPATVQEEGQVLVPIEHLSSYIETLRSGSLTLQGQTATSLAVEPIEHQKAPTLEAPERAAPLLVESSHISEAGTMSTNKATFQAWSSAQYPLPPIQAWSASPIFTCTLEAAHFKKALAASAAFARTGTSYKGNATEMYGVLLRLEEHALTLSATTGTMLISHRFLLEEPAPLALARLFEGKALFWMKEALPKKGTIRVALVRDVQTERLLLLLSTTNATWFCRSMDGACPTHWEEILHQPHEAEFLIRRSELKNPLGFFAKAAEGSEGVALAAEGTALSISTVASRDETVQVKQILSLVHASTDFRVLANPRQFRRLAGLAEGDVLRLEIGSFVRQEQPIGFLRASSDQMQVMMSLNREEKRQVPLPPSQQLDGEVSTQEQAKEATTSRHG
jgi:hypothetical protein